MYMESIPDDIKLENTEDFSFLVIKPSKINNLDFNNPGYLNELIKQDTISVVKSSPDKFIENIGVLLDVNNFAPEDMNVTKNILYDKSEYFYEVLFLDVKNENNKNENLENQFASLIDIENNKIYGNMLIIKSYIFYSHAHNRNNSI